MSRLEPSLRHSLRLSGARFHCPIHGLLDAFSNQQVVSEIRSEGVGAAILVQHIEPEWWMLNEIERDAMPFTALVDNIEKATDQAIAW